MIGRDGRLSGPELAGALAQGLQAAGVDVIDLGVVATPMVYYGTKVLDATSGIMVTGSHNPPDYNGFKMVLAGEAIHGATITALYDSIAAHDGAAGSRSRAPTAPTTSAPTTSRASSATSRSRARSRSRSTAATAWPAPSPATCSAAWAAKSSNCSAKSTAISRTTIRIRPIRKTCRT